MSRSKSIPKLLTRKSPSTGRKLAYARFDGRVVSFGAMGPEAEQQFKQTLAEWLANGRRLPADDAEELTVADVIAEYLQHAEQEYREVEVDKLRRAFKPVLDRFRSLPAAKFGVSCLEVVQHHLAHDLHERPRKHRRNPRKPVPATPPAPPRRYHLSRATVRARINAIRRCWRWAEQRRLVPPGSWEHLRSLTHVKPGRTPAKETKIPAHRLRKRPRSPTYAEPASCPPEGGRRRRRRAKPIPDDIAKDVCDWICEGNYLRDYCRQPDTPSTRTIYNWIAKDPEFARRFRSAREFGELMIAEQYLEVADSLAGMTMVGNTIRSRREFNRRYIRPIDLRLQRWRRWPRRKDAHA
ncbi:MAG: hypothetical protein NXI31_09115 [bacterium]|nr:hypothetical protein [bacterium]